MDFISIHTGFLIKSPSLIIAPVFMSSNSSLLKYFGEDLEEKEELEIVSSTSTRKQSKSPFRHALTIVFWLGAFMVVVLSSLNLSLLWKKAFSSPDLDLLRLPRIHSYAGLEEIAVNLNSTYEESLTIFNHPRVMTQVSSLDRDRVWPDDIMHFRNNVLGSLSPDARRFFIEPTINTVAQFRIVDFGMEKCYLRLNLGKHLANNTKWGWPAPHLNVWRLKDLPDKIDVRKLSWNHKPARQELLVHWDLTGKEYAVSSKFDCPWGTFPAFDFECDGPGCIIDFYDNPRDDTPSIVLVQTSSLLRN